MIYSSGNHQIREPDKCMIYIYRYVIYLSLYCPVLRTYIWVTEVIAEVKLSLDGVATETRCLDIGLHVDSLVGL